MTAAGVLPDVPLRGGSVRARLRLLVSPAGSGSAAEPDAVAADREWAAPGVEPSGREPGGLSARVAAALAEAAEAFATLRGVQERCYRALDELEASDAPGETGHGSAQRLAQEHLHLDASEATRLLREAHALLPHRMPDGHEVPAALPATAENLVDGRLGTGHVAVIERTLRAIERMEHVDAATRGEVEHQLAALAVDRTPAALSAAATEIRTLLDPDGAAPTDRDIPTDELHLTPRRDGSLAGRFTFADPVAAAAMRTALDAATPPATADGGRPADPLRTLAERRAQALLDLASEALTRGEVDETDDEDAPTAGGAGHRTRPDTEGGDRVHLAVTVDWELLRRRLGDRAGAMGPGRLDPDIPIGPETARRLACDADLFPAVLGARGEPLDIGRRTRVVPAAVRRALVLRDRHCAHPGCRRRARRCHAHHVEHWAHGGRTSLDNLVLLCSFHHAVAHHGGWTVSFRDGQPWFTPPRWLDPDRRPRHNRTAAVGDPPPG